MGDGDGVVDGGDAPAEGGEVEDEDGAIEASDFAIDEACGGEAWDVEEDKQEVGEHLVSAFWEVEAQGGDVVLMLFGRGSVAIPEGVEEAHADGGEVFGDGAEGVSESSPEGVGGRVGVAIGWCAGLVGIDLAVESLHGADDGFFGEEACEDGDGCGPVIGLDADGLEDGGDGFADEGQDAIVAIVFADGAIGADGIEDSEDEDHGNDEFSGAQDEDAEAFPSVQEDVFGARDVVGGQFHDEVGGIALEEGVFHEESRCNSQCDADHVDEEDEASGVFGEESGCKEDPDGELGSAAHEGGHEDGEEAVAFGFEGARGHDGGDGAAKADEHGDEGFSWEANPAHKAVHHKGGSRHISGVFQDGEAEEHESDGRQEGADGLEGGADAIGDESDEPIGCVAEFEEVCGSAHEEGIACNLKEGDEGSADDLCKPENEIHEAQEDGDSEKAMKDDGIDLFGDLRGLFSDVDDITHEAADDAVAGFGENDVWGIFEDVFGAFGDAWDFAQGFGIAFLEGCGDEGIALEGFACDPAFFDSIEGGGVGALGAELGE